MRSHWNVVQVLGEAAAAGGGGAASEAAGGAAGATGPAVRGRHGRVAGQVMASRRVLRTVAR